MSAPTDTHFDTASLEADADRLAKDFQTAQPFQHVVLDDMLKLPSHVVEKFPTIDWDGWTALDGRYQHNKRATNDIAIIPEPFAGLIRELSEPRFLRVLEKISGIEQLLPDPYLRGGGLHLSGPGGILSPHTDFHFYRELNLYRRINVLVYLNDDWSLEDGGCLSLFDEDNQPVKTVVPSFGRTVIFRTDDGSIHGFPEPVAEGKWRRSVALYYYTAVETAGFSGDEITYWREHGVQRGAVRKTRFATYRSLMGLARTISRIAAVVNPNQGLGALRTRLAEARRQRARDRG